MYKEYFQKSKVFLYPLLGIPKGQKFVPVGTYLAWEDEIDFSDMKFMCLYKQRESKAFYKFEDKYLLCNILFDDYQKWFGAGVTNLKMYYYSTGKIPPIEWLQANMSTVLNTREKLEATLSEEEKKLSYTSEPQG